MMVESMSATSRRFQRGSSGWTTTSTSSSADKAQRAVLKSPVNRKSAASPSSIQCRNAALGSTSRRSPSARSTNLSSSRPAAIKVAITMASKPKPPVALIAGPTASGKSALALALAEQSGGVIVNADSAQVYRDLPVLSAAPTPAELTRAEHRLYGFLDGAIPSSAADWAEAARGERPKIPPQSPLPILAGGTGLYLRTLLDGIAPVPAIDAEVRERVRERAVQENRAKLEALDPTAAARPQPADAAWISRALEVILSTGRTLAEWQKQRE